MIKLTTLTVLIVAAVCLMVTGCDKSVDPVEGVDSLDDQLAALTMANLPAMEFPPPTGEVTVNFVGESLTLWPFTGEDFSGNPQDPINLVFYGKADPRDIRAALLSLDGDRTAFGFPDAPPWNARWDDAIGDVQTGYAPDVGWTGGVVQLACGEYGPIRFHLRLFKMGQWTVGNAHFELYIPGTADHQVLSWERAEEFVTADMVRCGLLDGQAPMGVSQYINQEPFRTIPAIVYEQVPPEIRAYIGDPAPNASGDVPIATDGILQIFNLAGQADRVAEIRTQDFVIEYDIAIPKPFCASGPYDGVYIAGPVSLVQTSELSADGQYRVKFRAEGELSITPISLATGEPTGETLKAIVKEHHDGWMSDSRAVASALLLQNIVPASDPNAGSLLKRIRVSSNGPDGFRIHLRCPDDAEFFDVTDQAVCQVELNKAVPVEIEMR